MRASAFYIGALFFIDIIVRLRTFYIDLGDITLYSWVCVCPSKINKNLYTYIKEKENSYFENIILLKI